MEWCRWVHSGTRTGALKKPCLAAWVQRTDDFHGKSQDFPWWLGVPPWLRHHTGKNCCFWLTNNDDGAILSYTHPSFRVQTGAFPLFLLSQAPRFVSIHLHFQPATSCHAEVVCSNIRGMISPCRTHQLLQSLPRNIKYTPENLGVNMIRFMSGAQS